MSGFPWDNLITAASTLTAGLGAVGLKSRSDRKDREAEAQREDAAARAERQRVAYQAVVANATEVLRNYRQVSGEIKILTSAYAAIRARTDKLTGDLHQALAEAELAGSDEARVSAGNLRRAETVAGAAVASNANPAATRAALAEFETAIGAFIDVVRS